MKQHRENCHHKDGECERKLSGVRCRCVCTCPEVPAASEEIEKSEAKKRLDAGMNAILENREVSSKVPFHARGDVKKAADHVLKKYDKTFRDLGKHETPDWEAEGWKTALRKIILDNYILETYANEKQGDRLYEMLEAFFARTRAEARLERDAEILATISKPYTAANALMNEHREGWNAALKRVRSLLNGSQKKDI